MITEVGNSRVQVPEMGMVLKSGDLFSKEVYLGEGAEPWEEVPDTGQLDPVEVEVVN